MNQRARADHLAAVDAHCGAGGGDTGRRIVVIGQQRQRAACRGGRRGRRHAARAIRRGDPVRQLDLVTHVPIEDRAKRPVALAIVAVKAESRPSSVPAQAPGGLRSTLPRAEDPERALGVAHLEVKRQRVRRRRRHVVRLQGRSPVALHVLQALVAFRKRADHAEVRRRPLTRIRRSGRARADRARPAFGGVVRVRHRVVPSRLERHARRAVRRRHERPRRVPRLAVPRLVGHEEVKIGEFGTRDERPAPARRDRIARHQVAHRRHAAGGAHRHPTPHEHALAEHAKLVHPVSPEELDVVRRAAVVARKQHERATGLRERGIHHAAAPDLSHRAVRAMRRDRQLDAAGEESRPAKRILTAVVASAI